MDIPLNIKRNYKDIVNYLGTHIKEYPIKNINSKEQFIHAVCHMVSYWFALHYGHTTDSLSITNYKKCFIYIFRSELSTYFDYHKSS